MELTNEKIYMSFINGAKAVMVNRLYLNQINVFPVADGDTGSNLFSTMQSVVTSSELKTNIKESMESIADSAITGARGNSGLIFAQYLQGISASIKKSDQVSQKDLVSASGQGVTYAYQAIENPVEGTMLTVMRVFHESLKAAMKESIGLVEMLENALSNVNKSVEDTPDQLKVLKTADVVDSGAKGFAYFIRGFVDGIKGCFYHDDFEIEDEVIDEIVDHDSDHLDFRYCTEGLVKHESDLGEIKHYLADLGDSIIQVTGKKMSRFHIHTNRPADFFQRLSVYGNLIEQKVDDMVMQQERVHNRLYDRVIVTDSIADMPQDLIDKYQVHVVNLSVLVGQETYLDKLTISNERILEFSKSKKTRPTSSQPTIKQVDNMYNYLLSYYKEVIVIPVAKVLSGSYNVFMSCADKYNQDETKVHVVDSKLNSVGQGLLVLEACQGLSDKVETGNLIRDLTQTIQKSKILVSIATLDNMISSGRLSVRAGKIGKKLKLKPLVTLDKTGKGAIFKLAFGSKMSQRLLLKHLKAVKETVGIKSYAVTYVDDPKRGEELARAAYDLLGLKATYVTQSSGIIALGAGKGAVALAYISH